MKYDIKSLTLDEKLRLLTGKNGWQLSNANGKLPDVFLSDGPHGLRMHDITKDEKPTIPATAMPTLSLVSYGWDPELAYLDGKTIADECILNGADVLLAPGINIKRTPLCGRNFEYFSEDPFLSGTLGKAYIEGVQSKGVGTSLKHFCANNRERERYYQSSDVDERTLREIYLTPFEIAAQAKPWTVMCAYNPINGVYASENRWLLNDVLREDFGYDGVIVSDWGAVHNSWKAAKATIDLEMPYRDGAYPELKSAYEKGWLTEEEINERVTKLLELMEKVTTAKKKVETTEEERHQIAVNIAKECMVLLKNEDNILPLKSGNFLFTGTPNYNPPLGGGGSAYVTTNFKQDRLSTLVQNLLGETANCFTPYYGTDGVNDAWRIGGLAQDAHKADVCVLCLGTNKSIEAEGYDRKHLRLPEIQEELINAVTEQNENVVVVLYAGSAVDMTPWIDKVKAVLLCGYAGEGGQEAAADLLVGNACPCGKLTETFPLALEDTPTSNYLGNGFVDRYEEGIFVGYRWYDAKKKDVLFPFGHGLSYAKFEYSNLEIEKKSEVNYVVSFTVKNVSNVDAKEISQVYVRDVFSMVPRPVKELKGFKKISLKAGESKRVSVTLNDRAFAYYSVPLKKWYVENGEFEILVGASSQDIRLKTSVEINSPDELQYSKI